MRGDGETYANVWSRGTEHADLEAIADAVEILELGFKWNLVVPLTGD